MQAFDHCMPKQMLELKHRKMTQKQRNHLVMLSILALALDIYMYS